MANSEDDLIPTRATLIGRLKNWKDQSSWQEFFDTYWKLIYGVARQGGLTDTEAQAVLQATMISVAERMPSFKYDPEIGSFKGWLQNITRLQIIGFTLKRRPSSTGAKTRATEIDPSGQMVDRIWEKEWKINLLDAAVTNVKRRLAPEKYQIYDFRVNKEWPPEKVAAAFGLSVEEVHSATNSIAEMVLAEVKRLEEQML
jgi:RNA polymerase sigma factor (sigma-70 family)